MLEFLPKEIREGLEAARARDSRRRSRLRVHFGDEVHPIRRFWHDGFAVGAAQAPHLRGLADVYDGGRHVFQCLIVATAVEGDELVCGFKRLTSVADRAPLDFWRDENAPAGFIADQRG